MAMQAPHLMGAGTEWIARTFRAHPPLGLLANRAKKQALPQCRKLLGLNPALPEIPNLSAHDLLLELAGIDLNRCLRCQKGTMIVVAEMPRI